MSPSRPAAAPNSLDRAAELERSGDLSGALGAYEAALAASPGDPDILSPLASLAGRMGLWGVAAQLWAQVSLADPQRLEAVDGRARALRELGQFDGAVDLLREALLVHPQEPRLWNSLGVTLTQDSQADLAITFLDEAVRLDGDFAAAVYNRGGARFDLGDLDAAAADFERAGKIARKPTDAAMIAFAAATLALARGDLAGGWDAYEARFSPDLPKALRFDAPGQRWMPDTPLAGRRLLVVAEQGLGDELMFANVLPDVLEALGANGQLSLAVEPRLVELFARSFPAADVSAYATRHDGVQLCRSVPDLAGERSVDLWTPMGSLLRRFRRRPQDFPLTRGYLRPDPTRVAHWRAWLGDGPPTVGISWRSGKLLGDRRRQYPAPELWTPLLSSPGVSFVNLQYGECTEELAAFRAQSGGQILEPPGLDIRQDIDDLAALSVALDLIVSVGNATAALAGACGAPLAVITAPAAWPCLGTGGWPWYPSAEALTAPAFGDWAPAMAKAVSSMSGLFRA